MNVSSVPFKEFKENEIIIPVVTSLIIQTGNFLFMHRFPSGNNVFHK